MSDTDEVIFTKQCPKCKKYNYRDAKSCGGCDADLSNVSITELSTTWKTIRKGLIMVFVIFGIISFLLLFNESSDTFVFSLISLIVCIAAIIICTHFKPSVSCIEEEMSINQYRVELREYTARKKEFEKNQEELFKTFPNKFYHTSLLSVPHMHTLLWEGRVQVTIKNDVLWVISDYNYSDEDFKQLNKSSFVKEGIMLPYIEYYRLTGEITREQHITGGGGGGSSISGAVIGGAIAGDIGAVIGSRKSTEEIQTYYTTEDRREVLLSYLDYESEERKSMTFEYSAYEIFEKLIPEKNYDIVQEIKKNYFVQNAVNDAPIDDITVKIKKLADLKDQGLLTEEEFSHKKAELLERI